MITSRRRHGRRLSWTRRRERVSAVSNEGEGNSNRDEIPPSADLTATEALLPTLIEAALAAVITMDEHGVVNAWNHRAEETFGWSTAEAVGLPLVDLIVPPQYRDDHNAGLKRFRETGEGTVLGQVLEVTALHRDGHEFPVELRISEAARVEGTTLFIAFVLDITDRKARESELVAAYEEARSSRQAIDEFVSMVVHELRQPMSVIMGYADLLLHELPAADEPRYGTPLHAILQKAQEASTLITDILTAAKLESGGLTAGHEVFDATERARAAVERAEPAITLRGGILSISGDTRAIPVVGDPGFVDTILDNLIGNAIIYSPSAPVVRVAIRPGNEVELVVSDEGKGIPAEMHERIFERFVRVHDRSREPGTGLGLYVARRLAQSQNGSLRLGLERGRRRQCLLVAAAGCRDRALGSWAPEAFLLRRAACGLHRLSPPVQLRSRPRRYVMTRAGAMTSGLVARTMLVRSRFVARGDGVSLRSPDAGSSSATTWTTSARSSRYCCNARPALRSLARLATDAKPSRSRQVSSPTSCCSTCRCPRWTAWKRFPSSARPRPTPGCWC